LSKSFLGEKGAFPADKSGCDVGIGRISNPVEANIGVSANYVG